MKVSIEVKEDDKVTTYTADLTEVEKTVKTVVEGVESFCKSTFKKEVYVKQQEKKD